MLTLALVLSMAALAGGAVAFPRVLDGALDSIQDLRIGPGQVQEQELIIACVGPMSGDLADAGLNACDGAELAIAAANAQETTPGYRLRLERFDDRSDPAEAEAIAERLGQRQDVVAVVGNVFSNTTIPAGRLYALYKLPAVTGFATNPQVTAFNPWYFRVIFNDVLESQMVALYLRHVLGHQRIATVAIANAYGLQLAREFSRKAASLGIEIPETPTLSATASPDEIKEVISQITADPEVTGVFLALYGSMTRPLVEGLRSAGFEGDILGSGAVGSSLLRGRPDRRHLLEGTFLVMPYTSETGSSAARRFERDFLKHYDRPATWRAIYGYDATLAILAALQRTAGTGSATEDRAPAERPAIGQLRQAIRDQLAGMRTGETGVAGLMGPIHFNADGDAPRSIYLSRIEQGQLRAAKRQLALVAESETITSPLPSDAGRIQVDAKTLLQVTQVVRAGIQLGSQIRIDEQTETFEAAFDLWFRSTGDLDVSAIHFPDAVEPIMLDQPSAEHRAGDQTYKRFSVRGQFRMNPTRAQLLRDRRELNIRFVDTARDLSALILVPDRDRMGLAQDEDWGDRLKLDPDAVIPPDSGWVLTTATLGQDVVNRSTLGNPTVAVAERPYSVFNATIEVERGGISLKRQLMHLIPPDAALPTAVVLLVLLGLTFQGWLKQQAPLAVRLLRLSLVSVLLLIGERLLINRLAQKLEVSQLDGLMTLFNSLWWLLPAVWVIVLLPALVWQPIERRTGYPTPAIARILSNALVLAVSLLCIASFELNLPLGSIGFISGALTIVLGIALQSLILDLFSGFLLNIERPFQVGHWINVTSRLSGSTFGRVTELNWRTTRIWTRDNDMEVIPNSVMSQARLTNYSAPSKPSRLKLAVVLDFSVPVEQALPTLLQAARQVSTEPGMLTEPSPMAVVDGAAEYGITYKVQVHHDHDLASSDAARTRTMRAVQQHLTRAGIAFAVPIFRAEPPACDET